MPGVDNPVGRYEGDPWDQQPGESARQYSRFLSYAEQPPGRRVLADIARAEDVERSTISHVAAVWRWQERARLRDIHDQQQRRDALRGRDLELAERSMNVALVAVGVMARTLRHIADSDKTLEPKDMPAWGRMVETMRRVALDGPDQTIAVTGPAGGPLEFIEEFRNLTPEQSRDRAGEMARSVLRAIDGGRSAG